MHLRPVFRLFLIFALALGSLMPVASATASTDIHPVRGFLPDLRFSLEGAGGQKYTESDFQGKTVLVFFGYASCPDICPTTMAQLAQVMDALGEDAARVQVIFISVDPHRDTPDILQAYVELFNESALGLTGTEKQITDIARRYRVSFQIEKPAPGNPGSYEVAHSRGIYVFDDRGRARLLASDGESVEELTQAVRRIMQP